MDARTHCFVDATILLTSKNIYKLFESNQTAKWTMHQKGEPLQ